MTDTPIRFLALSPAIYASDRRMFLKSVEIDFEAGQNVTAEQGSDPQAILRWSDDGGETWSDERWRPMGKVGEYQRRAVWRRGGEFYERMFELTCHGPGKMVVLGAVANIKGAR